jgi:hypothetical protein
MELVELGQVELTYTSLESLDYGAGGRLYGTMEGKLVGERLAGELKLTNLAERRADNVNLPTLRGVLTTRDDAVIWVELDGVATLRASDNARVFVTSWRFRTGNERYLWTNSILGVLEGALGSVTVGGDAHGTLFECRPTLT